MEAKTTDGGTAYVLNNVEGGSATIYVLAGSSQSELATNVNKKVEVTGPVQQPISAGGRRSRGQSECAASAVRAGRIDEGGC